MNKRGRGRPKGIKNGEGTTVLAPIKDWTIQHDVVVDLSISGRTHVEVGLATGYTPTRVTQILQDPRAVARITEVREKLRKAFETSMENSLIGLSESAFKRIQECLMDESSVPGSDLHKFQVNTGLDLLKGLGFLGKNVVPPGGNGGKNDGLPEALAHSLLQALNKADEAQAIREADYTIVEKKEEEEEEIEVEVEFEDDEEENEEDLTEEELRDFLEPPDPLLALL